MQIKFCFYLGHLKNYINAWNQNLSILINAEEWLENQLIK